MILLFSVDNNWNVGYKGDVLYKISEDLKRFRRLTTGNIVVMGRKTFDSLPDSKALSNRENIVITRNKDFNPPNTIVVNSITELFDILKQMNPNNEKEVFMIGGGNIANQVISSCHKAYITKIFKSFENTDASLHNLDKDDKWEIYKESDIYTDGDIKYQYVNYKRKE